MKEKKESIKKVNERKTLFEKSEKMKKCIQSINEILRKGTNAK